MLKLHSGFKTLSFFFILILWVASTMSAEEENHPFGEKKKVHLLPISMSPSDSYLESQITKSALRTLYQTGMYHIIVGDELSYKKLVIGIETLDIEAKRIRNNYQITITHREQKKGKILKRMRATNIAENRFLSKIEELLAKLFDPQSFKNDTTVIIDKRTPKPKPKSGGINVEDKTSTGADIDSNVVILTANEIELKRTNPQEYFKTRAAKNKKKNWGDEKRDGKTTTIIIPDEELTPEEKERIIVEVKEKPSIPSIPPKIIEEIEPEPAPALPSKPRKPIYVQAGAYLGYENLVTDDLLTDVKTSILRYGIFLEPRIWNFSNNSYFSARGSLISYSKKVIYRELSARLTDEWKLNLNYHHHFFNDHLQLNAGISYGIRSWANLGEAFMGIQTGVLKTMDLELGIAVKFPLFGFKHGIGGEVAYPLSQEVSYTADNFNDITSSRYKVFYDFYTGESSRVRLGYSGRALEIGDKPGFRYESSVISAEFIIDTSF